MLKLFTGRRDDDRIRHMAEDPEFLFRVGNLLGACEMVGHVLSSSDDPEKQRLGGIVLERLAWFPSDTGGERPPLPTPEAATQVRPPRPDESGKTR